MRHNALNEILEEWIIKYWPHAKNLWKISLSVLIKMWNQWHPLSYHASNNDRGIFQSCIYSIEHLKYWLNEIKLPLISVVHYHAKRRRARPPGMTTPIAPREFPATVPVFRAHLSRAKKVLPYDMKMKTASEAMPNSRLYFNWYICSTPLHSLRKAFHYR